MNGIYLSRQELLALIPLRDELIRVYVIGIRPYMDIATKVVGVERGISYQSLCECMFEEPARGTKTRKKFSKESMRRIVKCLERSGLIEIQSDKRSLIFRCLLASLDKSVKNKADIEADTLVDTKADTRKIKKNALKSGDFGNKEAKADTEADTESDIEADTPQSTDIYITTILLAREKFLSMSLVGSHAPANAKAWAAFLVDLRGFHLSTIMSPAVMFMFTDWVKAAITYEDAVAGIDHAEAKLGALPSTPKYYNNFVMAAKRERLKNEEEKKNENNLKPSANGRSASKPKKTISALYDEYEQSELDGLKNVN
jgi:hypothetical protein